MIWRLLYYNVKQNLILFGILVGVMILYMNVIVGMYDPHGMQVMQELGKMKMSTDMLKTLGFDLSSNLTPSLIDFVSQYYYGLLIFICPIIYIISVSNWSIAKPVDNGSMAYFLSTPNSRTQFAITEALFLIVSNSLLIIFLTGFSLFKANHLFPQLLDNSAFIMLNIGAILLMFAISGISFLCSCIFNESSKAVATSTGIQMAFLLIHILSNTGPDNAYLKKFTLFTLFDNKAIITNSGYSSDFIVLVVIGLISYVAGIWYFKKKDLPL